MSAEPAENHRPNDQRLLPDDPVDPDAPEPDVPDDMPLPLDPPVELPPDMPAPELVPSAPLPVLPPLAEEPDVPPLPVLLVALPLLLFLLDLLLEEPVLPLPVPEVCPLALLPEPVPFDMPEFCAYARGAAAQTTAEMTIVAIACFMICLLEKLIGALIGAGMGAMPCPPGESQC